MEQITFDNIDKNKKIRFIDLFCGIGGFRLGFEKQGYECVFSSDKEPHAQEMYEVNFGDKPFDDICNIDAKDIPDHDILLGGFPCQAFSISGKQKGFYDETRGTLFFEIYRILYTKRPKVVVLENVKNLSNHDGGNTLKVIVSSLESLGYSVSFKVLNAKDFGVPQNRERIIIIGNREGYSFDFSKLELTPSTKLEDYLDTEGEFEYLEEDYTLLEEDICKVQSSGLIFRGYRNRSIRKTGVRPGTNHLSRVHKQPNRIYSAEGMHPTLSSQETAGRYFIYVNNRVRKLTIDECYRIMGFPDDFKKVGKKGKLYERIGNSICVPMVTEIARQVNEQFFMEGSNINMTTDKNTKKLEEIYNFSKELKDISSLGLNDIQINWINKVVEREENNKAVFTVLVTSLTYKILNPNQDVRIHQKGMENGYSGRTFDTNYVTPFLNKKGFSGGMKESGWLTRSLEQDAIYDLDYKGKITPKVLKESFLNILNDVEINGSSAETYLKVLFATSIVEQRKRLVKLVNPIEKESNTTIKEIMDLLEKHFYYKYSTRGASILPVVAIYSVYECMVEELKRFNNKVLEPLASHVACDKNSKTIGDIEVKYSDKNDTFEGVEIKFDIPISYDMLYHAYNKFKDRDTKRYYILSTCGIKEDEKDSIEELVKEIENEHGCQVILNGLIPSIKYYLRTLENPDKFLDRYIYNVENHREINHEHKLAWNIIIGKKA